MADDVRCCIVGCGPAGAMLGFLLARAGIDVLVLEKHGDFLRDFRGDTIHSSTLEILDELGLAERFLALPHSRTSAFTLRTSRGEAFSARFEGLRPAIRSSRSSRSGTSSTSSPRRRGATRDSGC